MLCDYGEIIDYDNCAYGEEPDPSATCAMPPSGVVEDGWTLCVDSTMECETLNEEKRECGVDDGSIDSTNEIYQETYVCTKFDNGKTYWWLKNKQDCSDRCSEDEACKVEACTNDESPKCSEDFSLALNCNGDDKYAAKDCKEEGANNICVIETLEFNGHKYADCAEKCDTVGAVERECAIMEGGTVQIVKTCTEAENGQKYWKYSNNDCSNRCSETEDCILESCAEGTAPSCSGDLSLAFNCVENSEGEMVLVADDCNLYEGDFKCEVSGSYSYCKSQDD